MSLVHVSFDVPKYIADVDGIGNLSLLEAVRLLRLDNKTIIYQASTFDHFHTGHVKTLEEAKRQCDYLILGLQLDSSIDRPEKNYTGSDYCEEKGIEIYYKSRYNRLSSSGIRKN